MAKAKNVRKQATESTGFWDRPVLMDLVSDVFYLFGAAVLAWSAMQALQRLPVFPLRQVVVTTPLHQVGRGQIEHAARNAVIGNFFTVNLENVRTAFEKLPWVRRAEVRRHWPDSLELAIEEHVPVARWLPAGAEGQLVNDHGEVFGGSFAGEAALPAFAGPEGSSAEVLDRYRGFTQAVAPLGRRLHAVVLTARQAWQIRLDDGVVVELGRDQAKHSLADRLARFVAYYPAVRQRIGSVAGVFDMRYPNGFALRAQRNKS